MNGKEQILLQLHEQFSINQNDTFGRYNTMFIALFALFGFYGVAFGLATGRLKIGEYEVSLDLFFILTVVLSVVLSFLFCILIYMGYQHRRDQLLNTKIRDYFFETQKKEEPKLHFTFNDFFKHYQGTNKGPFNYLPDNIILNLSFVGLFKLLLLVAVIIAPNRGYAKKDKNPEVNQRAAEKKETEGKTIFSLFYFEGSESDSQNNINKSTRGENTDIFFAKLITILVLFFFQLICFVYWIVYLLKYKKIESHYVKNY